MPNAPLCFVSEEIHPATPGGIGRLIDETVRQLAERDVPVVLLLALTSGEAATFRRHARRAYPSVSVFTVDELLTDLAAKEAIPQTAFRSASYWRSYRIALALRRLLLRTPLSGIEFADFNGLALVALKWRRMWGEELGGVPIWIRIHSTSELVLMPEERSYARGELQVFAMERYALRHADGWISPSAAIARAYGEKYDCPEKPVVVAPPPFQRIGQGNQHPRTLGAPPYRILFYGKLQPGKGPRVLIEAIVSLLENDRLPIALEIVGPDVPRGAGRPSWGAELRRIIPPAWRDRVRLHGPIPPEELDRIACSCCLAVVPSRVEAFCLAAHEMNWIGIPLVLNDLPAFQDYFLEGVYCRRFDGTSADLARVLRELLGQTEPFARWQWNAGEIAAQARVGETYTEALDKFRTVPPPAAAAPLVSVVIPYYNMQDYIDATLDSVRASRYPAWEVVVVDDGSPAAAAQVKFAALKRAHEGDSRYLFLQKPNGGLGSARNFGIRHARGAYILPLDSDDLIEPEYLSCAVTALNRMPEVAAVTCFVGRFADGTSPGRVTSHLAPYDLHPVLITVENGAGVACSVFRREVFDRFSYDETLTAYEDWDLWWQLAAAGEQVEAMPRLLFRYRFRPDSMVQTVDIASEVQLLASFAQRHADHLRRHSGPAFQVGMRRIKELERIVRISRKYSLLFLVSDWVLKGYHRIRARPGGLACRLLEQFQRRSKWIERLCKRLDNI